MDGGRVGEVVLLDDKKSSAEGEDRARGKQLLEHHYHVL